ncbi:DUF6233 domain-containing protein [Streptomyces salinarius]|uniref:DUF6233 domain-containing protein n=1 Tax=Streptomyces salinarius TaxID=2762598 RepID=UPI003F48FE66
MPSSLPPSPPVLVVLPDGQELRGLLHARGQFPQGGWMYWVGLAMWADVPETEAVEPREYRGWLTADQTRPLPGVSYAAVPTHPLKREEPTVEAADRWAWKVQVTTDREGRRRGLVVHVWDCPEAPTDAADGGEVDVFTALEALRSPGAVACSECGADVHLGPLA